MVAAASDDGGVLSPMDNGPAPVEKKKKRARVVAPVDPAAQAALAELQRQFNDARNRGDCTCALLYGELIGPLRSLAIAAGVPIYPPRGDDGAAKQKKLTKVPLLLAMCMHCTTEDEVVAAGTAGRGAAREGVEARWWDLAVDINNDSLSLCDAFHLYMVIAAASADEAARYNVNRFRAHLLAHVNTNWDYYVNKGRQNIRNGECMMMWLPISFCSNCSCKKGAGSHLVVDPYSRRENFCLAMRSTIDGHYHGNHDMLYCGKLRSGVGQCRAFAEFHNCHAQVENIVRLAVERLIHFVHTNNVQIGQVAVPLSADLQRVVRAAFDLPALVLN